MRGLLLGLGLLSVVALAGPSKSAKCETRDKACLSARAIASNGSPLARLLTPTGSSVAMSGVTFTRSGVGAACTASDGGVSFPADGQPCVNSTGLRMRPAIADLAGASGSVFSSWTASNATVTSNSATAPDGTTTADTVTSTASGGYVYEAFTSTGGAASISVYASASASQGYAVEVYDATGAASLKLTTCTATTSWPTSTSARCTASVSSTISGHSIQFRIYPGGTAGTGSIFAWGGQPEWSAFPDDLCPQSTCNAETATVPKPSGMSLTEGCAKVCVTPTWTGTDPSAANMWILEANTAHTARLGYVPSGSSNYAAYNGTSTPSVGGSFTAGSRRCYLTQWSASGNFLKTTDLTSGATGSVGTFSGFPSFDSTLYIGFLAGSTVQQPLGAGIDSIVLGSSPSSCQ